MQGGTPREPAAETAALRIASVLACKLFWQRPATSLVVVSKHPSVGQSPTI